MKLEENNSDSSIIKGEELSLNSKMLIEILKLGREERIPFRFKVKGFSMSPFIRDNDIVTVSPPLPSVHFGMPVAFIHPESKKLVIHRVVGKNTHAYLIKGDNVFSPDGLIPQENILGYVSKIERNGRKIFVGLGRERLIIAFFNKLSLFAFILLGYRLIVPKSIKNILKQIF